MIVDEKSAHVRKQPASGDTTVNLQNRISNFLDASFLSRDQRVHDVLQTALATDQVNATLSWKFSLYYRFRWLVPIFVRQMVQRNRSTNFDVRDDWFIPQATMKQLADAVSQDPVEIVHPWPDRKPYSFVVTHDVETKYGLDLIPKMAAIEEKHGFRSSWNLIPKKYKIDQGLLDDLHARGFEIGVHGYNHDGRLFESKRKFQGRSGFINQSAARFRATGFRAPMVHRDLELIVEHLDFNYDASCFDVDPFQAMSGGVGSLWPFMIDNKIVELPYTMPQDHTLFTSLCQTDTETWEKKFDYLKRNCGMVMLLTHPDYMDTQARLNLYDRFLGSIREEGQGWFTLPSQLADWWREREKAADVLESGDGNLQQLDSAFGKFAVSLLRGEGAEVRIQPTCQNG